MITLRPYQEAAIESIMAAMPIDKTILVQAATGAGKTIIFCELIRRLLAAYPYIRIGILAHRRELITQAQDKLLKIWPEAPIGIACASVSGEIDTDQPVVIGSVQTLARRTETTSPFDLVIVDEAHRIPPVNERSQYRDWLQTMEEYNPNIRILGVTATPFRLGHGYIYGPACKPGNKNLFSDLHYRISISELQAQGFLCGYRAKSIADIRPELSGVKKTGDYNLAELSSVMEKVHHVNSAVLALAEHAADRRHVVVFAVTIAHAEKLKEAFGDQATVVHSEMPNAERVKALADFASGIKRVIVNVGVLTEGWDSPAVDCIIMCRPTVSPALYVQMTGRGLRIYGDKKDVLILDLASNCITHGDPNQPVIVIPGKTKKKGADVVLPEGKACPQCLEVLSPRANVCFACGYEFVIEQNEKVMLQDYKFKKSGAGMLVEIGDVELDKYVSRKGNLMGKLNLVVWSPGNKFPYHVNEYLQFESDAHPYARGKSRGLWRKLTQNDPPESTQEAVERQDEFLTALGKNGWIQIEEENKFWKVTNWQAPAPEDLGSPVDDALSMKWDEVPF